MAIAHLKQALLATALLAAAGCTTSQDFELGLMSLEGRPYKEAFYALGFPDGEREIDGKRVFYWGPRRHGFANTMATTTSSGIMLDNGLYLETQHIEVSPYEDECHIEAIVGRSGLIEHTRFDGTLMGCGPYAERLRP
ncbi:MAG: hypothetical protein KF874_07300 [Rhizobiaceae bacterium]|nr:hypothetical protein [Rhizobiaceae bacterium]